MKENENNSGLMEQIIRIAMLLRRYQLHNRKEEYFGDSHQGQGRVLALLKMKPEITQKELGYLLNIRNQSLGELLGKLERSGFITKAPAEHDRRIMNVKLTETGAQAADQAEQQQQSSSKLFECLTEEEQAQMGQYLKRIIEELEQQLGKELSEEEQAHFRFKRGGHGRGMGFYGHGGHERGEEHDREQPGGDQPHEHGSGEHGHSRGSGSRGGHFRGPFGPGGRGPGSFRFYR